MRATITQTKNETGSIPDRTSTVKNSVSELRLNKLKKPFWIIPPPPNIS